MCVLLCLSYLCFYYIIGGSRLRLTLVRARMLKEGIQEVRIFLNHEGHEEKEYMPKVNKGRTLNIEH